MSDIVERLRRGELESVDNWWFVMAEGANEIERLRAENESLHKQAEMNARLLTENASLRAENETLRRDVKTAIMGDSAELADMKRINADLRDALIDAAGELQHAYIMGFTERYRDAAHAARRAVGAMGDKND